MLGGGYPRGSLVLFEIDEYVSTLHYHLIVFPTVSNFAKQGERYNSDPLSRRRF
ncbi:MAG: hypothetical protein QXR45_11330 [Candidatus Bathyarchaeia archaeon]